MTLAKMMTMMITGWSLTVDGLLPVNGHQAEVHKGVPAEPVEAQGGEEARTGVDTVTGHTAGAQDEGTPAVITGTVVDTTMATNGDVIVEMMIDIARGDIAKEITEKSRFGAF